MFAFLLKTLIIQIFKQIEQGLVEKRPVEKRTFFEPLDVK
jgi:hypothetical protein